MNSQTTGQQTIEPVHPFDIMKPEWEVNRKSVRVDSLIARHDIEPPDKLVFPPTTHHAILFQLSYGDKQVTHIGDKKHEGVFNSGEFFLHPANRSAFYSWSTTDEAIALIIEPTYLYRLATETKCLNPNKIELRPIVCDRDPHIEYIARSFMSEMQNEGIGGRLYTEALATQLGIHLLRNYCTATLQPKQYNGGLPPSKLQAAIDYIQANLEYKISLDTLGRVTKISPYHFARLFRQSTGFTPYQYVLQQRIELGKQLLRQEQLQISEISIICGFANQSSFTTTFRKLVGVTPKTYRKGL